MFKNLDGHSEVSCSMSLPFASRPGGEGEGGCKWKFFRRRFMVFILGTAGIYLYYDIQCRWFGGHFLGLRGHYYARVQQCGNLLSRRGWHRLGRVKGSVNSLKYREVQRSTERYREVQRSAEKYREVQRSTGRGTEVQGGAPKYNLQKLHLHET